MDEAEPREDCLTKHFLPFVAVVVIAVTASMFIGSCIGGVKAYGKFEVEAVKQGHAEYVINKEYEKEWRWLPPCGKKEEKK